MKIAIIVIICAIVYAIIGYAFSVCIAAWDDGDANDYFFEVGILWIFALPLLSLYLVAKFIGKKIAVIPVAIISLIKAKEKHITK